MREEGNQRMGRKSSDRISEVKAEKEEDIVQSFTG